MSLRYAELEKYYEGLVARARRREPACLWGVDRVLGIPAVLSALARRFSQGQ